MFQEFLPDYDMSTADGISCSKNKDSCPPGHEMETCQMAGSGDTGRYCKQCGEVTFQPNKNRFGDQCRMRRTCFKYKMKYAKYGDRVSDAECECEPGYHFENEDQRACVPNAKCKKGYGQTTFGVCEKCIDKGMYSDTDDGIGRCKPIRNCFKESRCELVRSDGTFDTKCGPVMGDVKTDCDNITDQMYQSSQSTTHSTAFIVGISLATFVVFILVLILIVCCIRRREARRKLNRITTEEMDEMLQEIIKRSKKDELFCKKVLTIAQKEVEDRINNQIWALPQELFRKHIEPAKYEVLLEKYKDKQHKYAINGYLQDWRGWRGDTSEAVEEMVACLKSDKVKREDIVYEIVMKLGEDFPEVYQGAGGPGHRTGKQDPSLCALLCPCYFDKADKYDKCKEAKTEPGGAPESANLLEVRTENPDKPGGGPGFHSGGGTAVKQPPPSYGDILSPHEAAQAYRSGPSPSAPVIDDDDIGVEVKGTHFYDRSDSHPVQCSS